MTPPSLTLPLLALLTLSLPAAAAMPTVLKAPAGEPADVFGGEFTKPCGWPTTVSVEGSCTGTLVHPEVVIYAAHCGTGYSSIQFGESGAQAARSVPVQFCKTFPGGGPGSGQDFAVCKLAEPQLDVPIVPILMGCETDKYLQPGQTVTIVGFGFDENNDIGVKKEVVTTINSFENNEAFIGGNGKDSCNGDSGGPVFVQIDDGTWRVFGITSYGGECGTGGYYSMMHNGISWFEQETGLDLTPCHNTDGTWAPQPGLCGGFPTDPGAGAGSWGNGCSGGAAGGPSNTCGVQCDGDVEPPTATITAPADDTQVDAPDMMANVVVPVNVDAVDVGCAGVKEVRLMINGSEIPNGVDNVAPYSFDTVSWPTGCFEVGAKAIDYLGNEGLAEPHTLCINTMVPPPPDPDTDSAGSGSGGSGGSGDPTEGGGSGGSGGSNGSNGSAASASGSGSDTVGQDEDEACNCRSGQGPGGSLLALAGLILARPRRRRA